MAEPLVRPGPSTPCLQKERIKKIDTHKGFVKGVTWDPVGNYLATQVRSSSVNIAELSTV